MDRLLHWMTLTRIINEAKSPNNFLMRLLYGNAVTVPTRHIMLSYLVRGRKMAGFVKRDGAAILVDGGNEHEIPVTPTHIRNKRVMSPSDLLNKRRAGTRVFASKQDMQSAQRAYLAREMKYQLDDAMNTEEWLAAQSLRAKVSYTSVDEASFEITIPRPAAHDFSLATTAEAWETATASPKDLFLRVMELINDAVSLNVTDVILGREAADAFCKIPEVAAKLDTRRFVTGTLDLTTQFQEDGALFLGAPFHNIRVWRYGRKVEMPDGTVEDLIRPKYAEFVCATQAAEFTAYYGAIEDFDAAPPGSLLESKRFMKSKDEWDPSAKIMLMETNPLMIPRRPDSTASVQVVS